MLKLFKKSQPFVSRNEVIWAGGGAIIAVWTFIDKYKMYKNPKEIECNCQTS